MGHDLDIVIDHPCQWFGGNEVDNVGLNSKALGWWGA